MAIDILSIPPSSAEPERTCSDARRTQSWDRPSLTTENLEILECVGNWLRNGHIQLIDLLTIAEIEDGDIEMSENESDSGHQ
jgi:hypothetical protein